MGEIIEALDIDKTTAGEVSSALYRLRQQGTVLSFESTATSNLGKRMVKRYRYVRTGVIRHELHGGRDRCIEPVKPPIGRIG